MALIEPMKERRPLGIAGQVPEDSPKAGFGLRHARSVSRPRANSNRSLCRPLTRRGSPGDAVATHRRRSRDAVTTQAGRSLWTIAPVVQEGAVSDLSLPDTSWTAFARAFSRLSSPMEARMTTPDTQPAATPKTNGAGAHENESVRNEQTALLRTVLERLEHHHRAAHTEGGQPGWGCSPRRAAGAPDPARSGALGVDQEAGRIRQPLGAQPAARCGLRAMADNFGARAVTSDGHDQLPQNVKLAAASSGKLLRAYFTENTPEPSPRSGNHRRADSSTLADG